MGSQLIHKYTQNTAIRSWESQVHRSIKCHYGKSGKFWGGEACYGEYLLKLPTGERLKPWMLFIHATGNCWTACHPFALGSDGSHELTSGSSQLWFSFSAFLPVGAFLFCKDPDLKIPISAGHRKAKRQSQNDGTFISSLKHDDLRISHIICKYLHGFPSFKDPYLFACQYIWKYIWFPVS